jgi:transcriptional/translational regulatory protein YebC/TACO1
LKQGADDVDTESEGVVVIETTPENFNSVKDALEKAGFTLSVAEVAMVASTQVNLDAELSERVLKLIDVLEDLDDVQSVYTNAELAEEVLTQR